MFSFKKKQPDIGVTASSTWRDSFDDAETGVAVSSTHPSTQHPSTHPPPSEEAEDDNGSSGTRRKYCLTVAAATTFWILVLGLIVGVMTARSGGDGGAEGGAAQSQSQVQVPGPEPGDDLTEETTASLPDDDVDPALMPSPSASPLARATNSPTKSPTSHPSAAPSAGPSVSPSTASPTRSPITEGPTSSPTISGPFFFGEEFVTLEDLGIEISKGLSAKVIARTGEPVQYYAGGESDIEYHSKSDAAGIVLEDPANPLESGYAYVTNSEEDDGEGGVYAMYFDRDGNVLEFKQILAGTSRNCGGGHTPWNTWISCEEQEDVGGQCWQIDPYHGEDGRAEATVLGGKDGGEYESVACDNRNPESPIFFVTEDLEDGALRRFEAEGAGWDALHSEGSGETTFLEMFDDGTFMWTTDEKDARKSAKEYYPNSEGIQFHEGKVHFMAKKDRKLFVLDVDDLTYEWEETGKKFYGEGSFGDQPDQNVFGPTRKYAYFTEDGGESPGVYARYNEDGTYFTIFQGVPGGMHDGDETIGIALSPDHTRLYAGIQDAGLIFEIARDDGLPFE